MKGGGSYMLFQVRELDQIHLSYIRSDFFYTGGKALSLMAKQSIGRKKVASRVHDKLQGRVSHRHIFDITSLLFDEILSDLQSGKPIEIIGLGTIALKERAPKPFWDVNFQEMRMSKGTRTLTFSMDPDLRAKIAGALDTPPEDDELGLDDGRK